MHFPQIHLFRPHRLKSCPVLLFFLAFFIIMCAARPSSAAKVRFDGLTAEVPEGWSVKKDEQIVIYNQSENSAVIIDQITNGEITPNGAAKNLAGAVGVDTKNIRRDTSGALTITFVQSGEEVCVRVLGRRGNVLMICAYGSDENVRKIAASVSEEKSNNRTKNAVQSKKEQLANANPTEKKLDK